MSRLVKTMITSFIILIVGGAIALIVVLNVTGQSLTGEEDAIEQLTKYSYETPEVTTDLKDGHFVRIQFQVVTDGKNAHEEISKRDFQLKNILIKELAQMEEEDFKSDLEDLESAVLDKLNELMTEGEVTDVYTTNKILQ